MTGSPVRPPISEDAGDQMICSDMLIIRMCEMAQGKLYTNRGTPQFPGTQVCVYGVLS